jgi:hypothetical protein
MFVFVGLEIFIYLQTIYSQLVKKNILINLLNFKK